MATVKAVECGEQVHIPVSRVLRNDMTVYHERLGFLEVEAQSALFYQVSTEDQPSFWVPKADFKAPPAPKVKQKRGPKQKVETTQEKS
jgi:hypothetical protein